MAMTMTQKILAAHAGQSSVAAGELILADLDRVLGNDITAPVAIEEFRKMNAKVFDSGKVSLVMDHFAPNKDIKAATQCKMCRDFAAEHDIEGFYDGGTMGVEHALLPESGLVTAGDVVIGADSHTCTYGALGAFSTGLGSTEMAWVFHKGRIWMKVPQSILFRVSGKLGEFVSGKDLALHIMKLLGSDGGSYCALEYTGSAIRDMSLDSRMSLCNMAVEAGAKNGIIEADDKVAEYLKDRTQREYEFVKSDPDAQYARTFDIDGSALEPQIALPGSSANSVPVSETSGVEFTRALLGTCTNGRMEDFREAAKIIKGRKVDPKVRLQVIPGSRSIFRQCIEEGITQAFLDAGAIWCNPNCGPCAGGHYGLLGKGEVCVSSSNRNMTGRMGDSSAKIYLASPATVAASAVTGRITDPREILCEVPV